VYDAVESRNTMHQPPGSGPAIGTRSGHDREEERMRTRNLIVLALAFAVIAVGAATPGYADEAAAKGLLKKWMAAYNSGDLKAVAALYAEDGCRMPPNLETVTGREAILESMNTLVEMGITKVKIGMTSSGGSGDHGYTTGTFAILDADGNKVDYGKWMNTLIKVGDDWMIQCDIWNSNMPLEMEEMGEMKKMKKKEEM
jgi:ketosteroid isomerase-like protein